MNRLTSLAAMLVMVAAVPALAGPVVVTSGEHEGFTRIALDFGHPVDWQMGRTVDGYALRIQGEDPDYDLSAVYKLIGRDRIATLWQDAGTGDLNLGVGCACYAMPFAFRPSIVVIDIRTGKPPKGSAFEEMIEPSPKSAASPSPQAEPELGSAYDWVQANRAEGNNPAESPDVPVTPLPVAQGLEPLRKSLLEEMSRGAAAGLIDLSLPRDPTDGMVPDFPLSNIALGDLPNYQTHLGESSDRKETALGQACFEDTDLDIENWADPAQPVAAQLAGLMNGLVGEFDKPDEEKVEAAIKLDLNLGFGAEARALIRAFPGEGAMRPAWESMGFLLDGEPDPVGAFRTQAGCDTAAALWAVLSIDALAQEPSVNTKAVVRAFSSLPPHLRRNLGARLADQLLSIGDDLGARAVRNAVRRLPGEKPGQVTLLEAKMDVVDGDLEAATERLLPLTHEGGPESEQALAELVVATAESLKPVTAENVDALAALAQERRDGPEAPRFEAAVTLGRAAAGQFDEAFARLTDQPELEPQVWSILSVLGTDDDVARHAIRLPGDPLPPSAAPAAARLAERLLDMGFVSQAADWLALAPEPDPLLIARTSLARKDGDTAVRAVAGLADDQAQSLKAEGLTLTGNHRAAADLYRALGQDDNSIASESRAQDWSGLADHGPPTWAAAAQSLLTSPSAETGAEGAPLGPLATARAIVAASEATRNSLGALLDATPMPEAPTQ